MIFPKIKKINGRSFSMINDRRRFYLKTAVATALSLNLPRTVFAQAPFLQFTDLAGRSVVLTRKPNRFVVANYIANFLFVGGAKAVHQIVGITADGWKSTRYAEYVRLTEAFTQLKNIPSIGGYHDDILNTEKILSLKPDVVILGQTQYAQNAQRLNLLEKAGIAVVVLDYHAMTLENHVKSTQLLGKLLNREKIAEEQIARYSEIIHTIQTRIAKADPKAKRVPVYVECGNLGIGAYGNTYNGTVLWGGILRRLQANNIAADMPVPYASLSREFVLSKNPGIIFLAGSIWQNAAQNDQMRMGLMVPRTEALQRLSGFIKRPLWDRLQAVQNRRVYGVDHGSLRSMLDYTFSLFMAQVIYSGLFDDFDPEAEIQSFYKRYLPEVDSSGTFTLRP